MDNYFIEAHCSWTLKRLKITFSLIILFIIVLNLRSYGQKNTINQDEFAMRAYPVTEAPHIDGLLNETFWQTSEIATDFQRQTPIDTGIARSVTRVKIGYDAEFLYIGVECEGQKKYICQSLRRDFDDAGNDFFAVVLDPFGDLTNGFHFYVTPQGVQREGMLANGGAYNGRTVDWDNKWFAETKIEGDRWTAELAIPFKSLRYKAGASAWRVNFIRQNLGLPERSCWVPVGINYAYVSLANTGVLHWETAPPKHALNLSLIPYVSAGGSVDYTEKSAPAFVYNAGGDAKIAVTSALNLDLTINPDFSQVEVDRQITNLSRFELFFPERRQFFLENSDLFATFGFSKIRPIFTRRIGLAYDPQEYRYRPTPIWGAARLSGKLDKNWRVGVLAAQTGDLPGRGIESQNFITAAVQRQIFGRSNVSAIWVNRQGFGSRSTGGLGWQNGDFNRVVGLDYNLSSKDNKWFGKIFYHRSFSPGTSAAAHASFINYNDGALNISWNHEFVDDDYAADVGYVLRRSYWRLEPSITYYFYPKGKKIYRHGPTLYSDFYWNKQFRRLDRTLSIDYEVNFVNTANIYFSIDDYFTRLFFPFDPTNSGGAPLAEGTEYFYRSAGVSANSDRRRLLTYSGSLRYGGYFNGKLYNGSAYVGYRLQPWGAINVGAEYNGLRFPAPYASADLWLSSLRLDLTFTRKLFFTTFLQFNSQINNMGINARFQWRFMPVSDLFIVYSDNYQTEIWGVKNRSLVVRLNYWFTI